MFKKCWKCFSYKEKKDIITQRRLHNTEKKEEEKKDACVVQLWQDCDIDNVKATDTSIAQIKEGAWYCTKDGRWSWVVLLLDIDLINFPKSFLKPSTHPASLRTPNSNNRALGH